MRGLSNDWVCGTRAKTKGKNGQPAASIRIPVGGLPGDEEILVESERQALALMNHPNITKALDAGETDTGRPYFAMELVRGIPITAFCDQQQLDVEVLRQQAQRLILGSNATGEHTVQPSKEVEAGPRVD